MSLRLTFILLSVFLSVCGAEEADRRALNLLCWTSYVPASVIEGFTRRSGVKVITTNYNSNEQMLSMLQAKPAFYDLVQPSQAYVEILIKSNGLEVIDRTKVPNWSNLDPKYLNLSHDPENKFSIPWLAGTVGIVVNSEKVKESIKTWADVFSGRYRGHIVVVNDSREMVAWALASLGQSINDIDDANLTKVEPILRQWLPQVSVFDSDNPSNSMSSGEAVIGIVWSGEVALLWQQDHKYRYVLPETGRHMFLDSLAIPAGAPHKTTAEKFINYCLEPEVSALISSEYPYTNPNRAARGHLTADQLANPASYLPDDPTLLPLRNVGNDSKAIDAFVNRIRSEIAK